MRYLLLLLLAGASLLASSAPTIQSKNGKEFVVSFEKGAVWGCTVFRMVKATEKDKNVWPDGHYAPQICDLLQEEQTTYTEVWSPYIPPYHVDWDVYAVIQYPDRDTFKAVESNRVRVHY